MSKRRLAPHESDKVWNASEAKSMAQGRYTLSHPNEGDTIHKTLSQPERSRRSQRVYSSQPIPSSSHSDGSDILSRSHTTSHNDIEMHEEKQLASDVIRYIFVMNNAKKGIQRVHIVKNVLNGESKKFSQVMNQAQTLLSQIFGYKLMEFESGKYLLVNEVKNDILCNSLSVEEKTQQVLLFIILTHIFMCDGLSTEDTMFDFLCELEIIHEDSFYNDYFGDIKQLINDFVNQMYLKKSNPKGEDTQKVQYSWGPRAKYELTPRDVLEFVSQVYGGQALDTWPRQFKAIQQTEEED